MSDFNAHIFLRSFQYAAKGLRFAFRHEQNFRVQCTCAVCAIVLMIILRVSTIETVVILLVISSVLVLELLNTVLEKFIDVLKPRVSYFIEIMKDLIAAAVFVASLFAFLIGCIIFIPKIF